MGGRQLGKLAHTLINLLKSKDLPENLPESAQTYVEEVTGLSRRWMPRYEAYRQVHFPLNPEVHAEAVNRLKFEELFLAQVRLGLIKSRRASVFAGCRVLAGG